MMESPQKPVFADPLGDDGFKILFGENNKENMLNFLRALLPNESIEDIEYLDKEQHGLCLEDGESSFDLLCSRAGSDDKFIVEMQKTNLQYFNYRSVYYSSHLIQIQAATERERQRDACRKQHSDPCWNYKFPPVIFIGILEKGMGGSGGRKDGKLLEHYRLCEIDDHRDMDVEINFLYLHLDRFGKEAEDADGLLEQFVYSLKNIGGMSSRPREFESEEIRRFYESAFLANLSAEERHLIETSRTMTTHNDYLVALAEAKEYAAKIGRQEGLEQGLEEGRKKGIEEGRAEGRAEGIEQGIASVARKMLGEGLNIESIAKYTGLSPEDIQKL